LTPKIGTTFPQTTIGNDPVAIRDFAQAIEGAGYDYLIAYEHIVGADQSRFDEAGKFRPDNSGVTFTNDAPWHDLMTLFAFMSAHTTKLEFASSVVMLPQRQTVLAAKQMAELDILSGGRCRFGVGIGWNFTEYEALNEDWDTRTEKMEDQLVLLKRLWTEHTFTHQTQFHHLDRVGINPRPEKPLPIWYAGSARNVVLKRAAQYCDGWTSLLIPPEEPRMAVARLHKHLREAGKDPAAFGIEGRTSAISRESGAGPHELQAWKDSTRLWTELGATHIGVSTYYLDKPASAVLDAALDARAIMRQEMGI
jgi:probable F420-dependent oxidoreductase